EKLRRTRHHDEVKRSPLEHRVDFVSETCRKFNPVAAPLCDPPEVLRLRGVGRIEPDVEAGVRRQLEHDESRTTTNLQHAPVHTEKRLGQLCYALDVFPHVAFRERLACVTTDETASRDFINRLLGDVIPQ